jgi:hypothetical protein
MSDQKSLNLKFEIFNQINENILVSCMSEYQILFTNHFLQILFFETPFKLLE